MKEKKEGGREEGGREERRSKGAKERRSEGGMDTHITFGCAGGLALHHLYQQTCCTAADNCVCQGQLLRGCGLVLVHA